ncbi:unnamed protein product, partial [Tetraodon nigroviridis]
APPCHPHSLKLTTAVPFWMIKKIRILMKYRISLAIQAGTRYHQAPQRKGKSRLMYLIYLQSQMQDSICLNLYPLNVHTIFYTMNSCKNCPCPSN